MNHVDHGEGYDDTYEGIYSKDYEHAVIPDEYNLVDDYGQEVDNESIIPENNVAHVL